MKTDEIVSRIRRYETLALDTRHDSHNRSMFRKMAAAARRELGAPPANLIAVGAL